MGGLFSSRAVPRDNLLLSVCPPLLWQQQEEEEEERAAAGPGWGAVCGEFVVF
jgi:hypothetical protein